MVNFDNSDESRAAACRALISVRMAEFIGNCAMLDGIFMSVDNIQATLDKGIIRLGGENGKYIEYTASALNTINIHWDQPEDLYFIRDLYAVIMADKEYRYELAIDDKNSLLKDIHRIHQIQSPIQRAAVMFGYIIQKKPFHESNGRMAYLVANKILIHHGRGFFLASGNKVPSFRAAVTKYEGDGNHQDICKFLIGNCHNSVIV